MELNTEEIIKKKILDAQENVRDYEMHSYNISDPEVSSLFKKFAEDSAMQATKLKDLLSKF